MPIPTASSVNSMNPIVSMIPKLFLTAVLSFLLLVPAQAQNDPNTATSDSSEIHVLPAPGPVVIDGKDSDWDLSAGIWSYSDPTLVDKYSTWTHLMWDEKGIYLLVRYHDVSPMQNATLGKDFMKSWRADAMQARVVFDEGTPEEHQMHINLFYSTPEEKPYMIVKHGGFKSKPPYDATGPDRPDQLKKYGNTMDKAGGKIAFQAWPDGKGYTMEAFWPWSYLRTSGAPLQAGESFALGIEDMWGNADGTALEHRTVDNLKNAQVNRIFFFRAKDGWGRAILSDKGNLDVTEKQKALEAHRLKKYVNYDTVGSIPIKYTLKEDRDVTIAIDNKDGERVRNLFGQYPRKKGENVDYWDGLDDEGNPVPPGEYTVQIVDHAPIKLKVFNSLYNAATPPWPTPEGKVRWGSDHGYPVTVATRGDVILLGFDGVEGGSGLLRVNADGIIQWDDRYELRDVTLGEKFAYALSKDSWITKVVMRRYDLETGKLDKFKSKANSPEAPVPTDYATMKDGTIALSGGKVFVMIRDGKFYRMDPVTGAVEAEVKVPGLLALDDRDGVLRGLFADGSIYELSPDGKKKTLFMKVKGLKDPRRFAISQDQKKIAISDWATNQVFIYNPQGKLIQTLGEPYAEVDGMRPAGKYIQTNFIRPLGLDFDAQGRLWVAEAANKNKRITRWSPDGKLQKQFWGAPDYGAMGGFPFVKDSTRFIARGVEFKLDPNPDPKNRPTEEKPLAFHPALADTRGFVYEYKGHEYAVTVPGFNKQEELIIAKRNKEGYFQPVVRVHYGKAWKKPPVIGWTWIDKNENGKKDAGETTEGFEGRAHYWSVGWVRPDLTFITPDQKVYRPTGMTPGGVPLYDFTKPETLANHFPYQSRSNHSGTIMMDKEGNVSDGIYYATVDGRTGNYPNLYGRHDAPAARRGRLIAPFRTNGVIEEVPGIGSMTAIGGDRGEWFLMSMDGLYISSILQDSKGDVELGPNYVGSESFGGFIWRDEKGRVLAQLGASSYLIMQVLGLDTIEKETQKINVTKDEIDKGIAMAATAAAAASTEPTSLEIAHLKGLPKEPVTPDTMSSDSLITGAQTIRVEAQGNPSRWFRVALAQNGKDLAISWQVNDESPWKNAAGKFTHAFIGGDSVDLQLDVPGRGPIRLLTAPLGGKDTVIYWQQKADTKENPTTYVVANNPSNAQKFDVVKVLEDATVVSKVGARGYSVLVKVPLAELGLDAKDIGKLKGLVGVIYSDPTGTNRMARLYWHDKNTGMVSDVPSESRLTPETWGEIIVMP